MVDFLELLKDKGTGYDNLMVVIDTLSKRSWCMPCHKEITARGAAKLYYKGPYRQYGIPLTIGSDKGPQFAAELMDELTKILGIKWKLSSSGHSVSGPGGDWTECTGGVLPGHGGVSRRLSCELSVKKRLIPSPLPPLRREERPPDIHK